MTASQGVELERVGVTVPGLIRLWKSVVKSKHPRMKPIRGAPGAEIDDPILNVSFSCGMSLVLSPHGEFRKWYPQPVQRGQSESLGEFDAPPASRW